MVTWESIRDWKSDFDTNYIDALKEFLPHADGDQIIFLWDRLFSEWISGDDRRERMAESAIGALADIHTDQLSQNRTSSYGTSASVTTTPLLIALVGYSLEDDEKRVEHKRAWRAALESGRRDQEYFLKIMKMIDASLIWELFEESFLEDGVFWEPKLAGFSWSEVFNLLLAFVEVVPIEKADDMLGDIFHMDERISPYKKAKLVAALIDKSITSSVGPPFGDDKWTSFVNLLINDNKIRYEKKQDYLALAAELVLHMPEHLRPGQLTKIIRAARISGNQEYNHEKPTG